MQTFIRAILYIGCGAAIFAILFCLVALVPGLDLDPQGAAVLGAIIGAVVGVVYGTTRRFQ